MDLQFFLFLFDIELNSGDGQLFYKPTVLMHFYFYPEDIITNALSHHISSLIIIDRDEKKIVLRHFAVKDFVWSY